MKFLQVCGYAIVFSIAICIAMALVVLGNRIADVGDRTVRIDCTIAEISPDIPVDAKEQCRKLRMEKK